ncbi:MAG: glycoside hydrolase family 31 protein [Ruminococcaceae bacterium]|nr:glycoside hydrolase family 31 protein [Oscillospiraceae bacterium]
MDKSFFKVYPGALEFRRRYETVRIEAWGENGLRVRATENLSFTPEDWALSESVSHVGKVGFEGDAAFVENGDIRAEITEYGRIRFLNSAGKVLLSELYRTMTHGEDFGGSRDLHINQYFVARKYRSVSGDNYTVTQTFDSVENEKIFGMGQYQQNVLNLKGCVLDLCQLNTQATVPFYVSSLGYGFLMNNPAVGKVSFGRNQTQWSFESTKQIDYWITAGETPAQLLRQYTAVAGRAPMMPEYAMGFWQCKLRYQTQEELLSVAREYRRRGIPLDVIVVDFFHWTKMGEWKFDPQFWPDPEGMIAELSEMGIRLVVSIWPTVDMQSENMAYMADHDMLIRTNRGMNRHMECMDHAVFSDMTNPATRDFVWSIAKKNYVDKGVCQFWLDVAEPEFSAPDFENYRYHKGHALEVANCFPAEYSKMFWDGIRAEGRDDVISLVRCAWAGSQKYGALAWSGDVRSTFPTLRRQIMAGLNMGMAGIPWWNADIGGFMGGDINSPQFRELLMRWFAFGTFSPVMRLHGDRDPHTQKPFISSDGKACAPTGADNEVWSYGEDAEKVLVGFIEQRYRLRPYIARVMAQAHENGSPAMRPLFYNFPEDGSSWAVEDAYCFGDDLLVAPVLEPGVSEREVYLPAGSAWIEAATGRRFEGGQTVTAAAPIDVIPVFVREGSDVLELVKRF